MTLSALMLLALAPNAEAVQAQQHPQTDEPVVILPDVEVTTTRRGVALGGQEPIVSYDAAQIQAFGATNIGELVSLLEAQTRSARGGAPVFLVNGRRISGFREIRGLPPEAIERFDVLPEETALSYGYSADQRVVNVVLKAYFRSITASGTVTRPTSGGQTVLDNSNNVLRIAGSTRWSMDLNLNSQTALFETERNIDRSGAAELFDLQGNIAGLPRGAQIDPALSALAGQAVTVAGAPASAATGAPSLNDFLGTANSPRQGDLNAYRTLLPNTGSAEISGTLKKDLNRDIGATFSGSYKTASSLSYLGLPGVTLTLPSGNPYSPFGDDVQLFRYLDRPDALKREVDTQTAGVGTVLDGFAGDWRWTLTGRRPRRPAGQSDRGRPHGEPVRRHRRTRDRPPARYGQVHVWRRQRRACGQRQGLERPGGGPDLDLQGRCTASVAGFRKPAQRRRRRAVAVARSGAAAGELQPADRQPGPGRSSQDRRPVGQHEPGL